MPFRSHARSVRPVTICAAAAVACLVLCPLGWAKDFRFQNITDLPAGPGQGNAPDINEHSDIAFYQGTGIYLYRRSQGTFLNVTALPGAPTGGRFPKLNNAGNIAFVEASTGNLWLFEAATQAFTNISAVSGYPGNSQSHSLMTAFDLNDSNKVSFHSGDLNFGDVYVYDHAAGTFTQITDKPDGSWHGRDNTLNNADRVAYNGFPDTYLYDLSTGTTANLTDLPGGPGAGFDAFALNDRGDLAIFRPDEVTSYTAATAGFLYLSTLPGFPAGSASSNANDLSDRGEITFWRTNIYYFDPTDQSFTQLNNQGVVPAGGLESTINDSGRVAFTAGFSSVEDIYLATPLSWADLEPDGDVDGFDFLTFANCYNGSNRSPLPACLNPEADIDADGDVDGFDFLTFANCYNGSNRPPLSGC